MSIQIENKKIFWEIVNHIEGCSDYIIKNQQGVVTERGMLLDNEYSILFGLDDEVIRIYDNKQNTIFSFDENNTFLKILKDLFDNFED